MPSNKQIESLSIEWRIGRPSDAEPIDHSVITELSQIGEQAAFYRDRAHEELAKFKAALDENPRKALKRAGYIETCIKRADLWAGIVPVPGTKQTLATTAAHAVRNLREGGLFASDEIERELWAEVCRKLDIEIMLLSAMARVAD